MGPQPPGAPTAAPSGKAPGNTSRRCGLCTLASSCQFPGWPGIYRVISNAAGSSEERAEWLVAVGEPARRAIMTNVVGGMARATERVGVSARRPSWDEPAVLGTTSYLRMTALD
ncbi:hypothetical protein IMZ48_22895 [Candidatus Bathyarchaeota archaeon]|nr:hypothetical protein [Candidatus Bathyarchaeota archaeon]